VSHICHTFLARALERMCTLAHAHAHTHMQGSRGKCGKCGKCGKRPQLLGFFVHTLKSMCGESVDAGVYTAPVRGRACHVGLRAQRVWGAHTDDVRSGYERSDSVGSARKYSSVGVSRRSPRHPRRCAPFSLISISTTADSLRRPASLRAPTGSYPASEHQRS
jgi:hypothetical protein